MIICIHKKCQPSLIIIRFKLSQIRWGGGGDLISLGEVYLKELKEAWQDVILKRYKILCRINRMVGHGCISVTMHREKLRWYGPEKNERE